MVQIARQAKSVGIPGTMFVGGDGWEGEELLSGAGGELDGSFFTDHYAPDSPWQSAQALAKSFKAAYGRDPVSLSALGYDAAKLLFDAMGRATDLTPEAIKTALADTRSFPGATGTMTVDKNHDASKPIVLVQVKDKKLTYLDQLPSP
jgi:branched-chain amino acid transport system substrate-binding protein